MRTESIIGSQPATPVGKLVDLIYERRRVAEVGSLSAK